MTSRGLEGSTEQVVGFVRNLIERGRLRPGDRLPAERDLAVQIGVSRPTVRAGLRALAAMGVVQSRHGSGTYIPDGPPSLGTEPLSFLAALHGFTREEMYEARRILEVGAAGLAAERATSEQLATLAEEVASLFARLDDPQRLPRPRHQLSPQRRRGVGQSDRRVARRDGVGASTTSGGARPRSARPIATCATPPKCTGASTRRFAPATPKRARRAMHEHLLAGARYQAQEPATPRRRCAPPASPRRQAPGRKRDLDRMTRSLFDLTGRTAVVVGGTSGIGRALALGLADAGADVVATGRRQTLVDEVAAEIERAGTPDAAASRPTSATTRVAQRRCATLPRGLRAGRHRGVRRRHHQARADARDGRSPTGQHILDTNLTGTLRTYQVFAPPMIARGSGRLIGDRVAASFVGLLEVAAYTASKAGGRRADARARGRVGAARRHRQRDRARACSRPISNRALLDGPRGQEFLMRTPMRASAGSRNWSAPRSTSRRTPSTFVTGQLMAVDGGFLASGVNQ